MGCGGGGRGKPLTEEGLVKEEYQTFSDVIKKLLNISLIVSAYQTHGVQIVLT